MSRVQFQDLLAEPVRNGVYKPKEFHGSGVRLVNMKELFAFDTLSDQPDSRIELTPTEWKKSELRDGDLLFARRSFVLAGAGKCSIVVDPPEALTFESSMIRARPNPERADSRFLFYYFKSPQGRARMASIAARTAVSGITGGNLSALEIEVPAVDTQRRIAKVLKHFDDLIENNRRRVEVLEEVARAIYREWFVKFRYPGRGDVPLVDSAIGPIPEGWEWGNVDDLVRIVKDTVDPSTLDPGIAAVGLEHIPRGQITLDAWGRAGDQGSRKAVFTKGDVLFGKIRPYFHKVSVAPIDGISSTDAIVIRPLEPHWGQVVMLTSSVEFVAHATQTSNGTKMPRADWKVLGQWPVAVPPERLSAAFTRMARDQLGLAETLMFENRRLTALRDLLLPKLVTGQIDVSALNLGTLVEGAVA
ncbi:restriction endonuclease subunit S [Cellulomonas sp. Y8]|uniref:restriction endonuclease subunit S n=1 Tax=Cellulomonas sp. Y8 TaxID=2591145 RepID=UPI00143CF7D2|nr:restriction endonuclease subunit S [Cellulomonas sp. Y8]